MEVARPSTFGNPLLRDYVLDNTYDEMFTEDGMVRPHYAEALEQFLNLPPDEIARRKRSVDLSFLTQGNHVQRLRARGGDRKNLSL